MMADLQVVFLYLEHTVFTLLVIYIINLWRRQGISGVLGKVFNMLRFLPLTDTLIHTLVKSEVQAFTKTISSGEITAPEVKVKIPKEGET